MNTIMIMHICVCACACVYYCVHYIINCSYIFYFNTVSIMPVISTTVVSISHTLTSITFTPSGTCMFTVSVSQLHTYILVHSIN